MRLITLWRFHPTEPLSFEAQSLVSLNVEHIESVRADLSDDDFTNITMHSGADFRCCVNYHDFLATIADPAAVACESSRDDLVVLGED